jgi:hypothetical protein
LSASTSVNSGLSVSGLIERLLAHPSDHSSES